MSRVWWFQPVGGASGDIILAALLQWGIEASEVEEVLRGLGLGPIRLQAEWAADRGLRGLRVRVCPSGDDPRHGHEPARPIGHRSFADIRRILERSALPDAVKERSQEVFRRLAEVEGRVHGVAPDDVIFHEIGAIDSIADIVGCCYLAHRLDMRAVGVDAWPLGRGEIECAHGMYPLPAPATVELLRGHPIIWVAEREETVTPTGAAWPVAWANREDLPAEGRMVGVAYGLGSRRLRTRPNVLRLLVWDSEAATSGTSGESCLVLECTIDDQTPELVGVLVERLLAAGALDVYTLPAHMKKQRPGVLLTILCRPEHRSGLLNVLFRKGTTLGVRERWTDRVLLDRRVVAVSTRHGEVRVKLGLLQQQIVTTAPELDDCVRLAAEREVAVRAVYEEALGVARQLLGTNGGTPNAGYPAAEAGQKPAGRSRAQRVGSPSRKGRLSGRSWRRPRGSPENDRNGPRDADPLRPGIFDGGRDQGRLHGARGGSNARGPGGRSVLPTR